MKTQPDSSEWSIQGWRGGFDFPGGAGAEVTGIDPETMDLPEDYEQTLFGDPPLDEYYSPDDYFDDASLGEDCYDVFPEDPVIYV